MDSERPSVILEIKKYNEKQEKGAKGSISIQRVQGNFSIAIFWYKKNHYSCAAL